MRLKKILGILLLACLGLLAIGITFTIGWRPIIGAASRPLTERKFESTPDRMARGQYLTVGLGCVDCHSERDPSLPGAPPREGKLGAGAPFDAEGVGTLIAPNITPEPETGAGTWSDDALARAIREGIGHDGRALFPIMPYTSYSALPDEDVASIIVYLRSIPPVRNPLPKTEIVFPLSRLMLSAPRPITAAIPVPTFSNPVQRGEFYVRMGGCRDCHTPQLNGQPIADMDLAGGLEVTGLLSPKVNALNITPDPTGIPYYDEATFLKVMRTGQIGARKLDPVMPWPFYRNLSDEDLKAMFAYLQTVKPVKHAVDNVAPPTVCEVCGGVHGLGDRN